MPSDADAASSRAPTPAVAEGVSGTIAAANRAPKGASQGGHEKLAGDEQKAQEQDEEETESADDEDMPLAAGTKRRRSSSAGASASAGPSRSHADAEMLAPVGSPAALLPPTAGVDEAGGSKADVTFLSAPEAPARPALGDSSESETDTPPHSRHKNYQKMWNRMKRRFDHAMDGQIECKALLERADRKKRKLKEEIECVFASPFTL